MRLLHHRAHVVLRRRVVRGVAMVVVAAGVVVVPTSRADALDITVDTLDDVSDPLDDLTSLREAVALANATAGPDTVMLGPGVHELTDCVAGEVVHDGTGGDLTIQGTGEVSIQQTCEATRILRHTTNGTTLAVTGVDLVGGPNVTATTVQGAAVAASNRLVLTDVTITGVDATPSGSVVEFDFGPGDYDLELHDVHIVDNTGAAVVNISNPSGLLVEGSTITGNTGAGISMGDGSPVTITGSTIADNGGFGVFTTGQGAGLQPAITITDTVISDNARGGFTCRNGCQSLIVSGSTVTGNGLGAAATQGGGLEFVTFQPAFATPSVSITDTEISGNHAQHDGGGLHVSAGDASGDPDPAQIAITGSTITGNHADCAGCRGGGVAAKVGSLVLTSSTVADNTAAGDGGGVLHTRGTSDTSSSTSVFTATGVTVSGNAAGGDGGGISTGGRTQTITGSRITDNSAGGLGGGLMAFGVLPLSGASSLAVEGSTIDANDAVDGGGVFVAAGALTDVTNSTVTGNTATGTGGGFAVNLLARLDLVHVTLTANTAAVAANLAASSPTTHDRTVVAEAVGAVSCAPYLGVPLPITSVGASWFDDGSCVPGAADTVDAGADPQLGALGDNGGPTPTRLPAATSPLQALVPLAACTTTVDQRGVVRPQGTGCEPGSVEVGGVAPPEPILGTPGRDRLVGTDGDDVIDALGGRDVVRARGGADTVDGGAGDDVVEGGFGPDTLRGGPGNDILRGGPGDDRLEGGPGFDVLIGGPGDDVLIGGPGPDLCFSGPSSPARDC